jgi:hypothetical protein
MFPFIVKINLFVLKGKVSRLFHYSWSSEEGSKRESCAQESRR